MSWWQIYLSSLGGSATGFAIVAYLSKLLFEHWYKKDFKRFEAKIDAITNQEQTKFEFRHSQQATKAIDLFKYAKTLEDVAVLYLDAKANTLSPDGSVEPAEEERASKAEMLLRRTIAFFERQKAEASFILGFYIGQRAFDFLASIELLQWQIEHIEPQHTESQRAFRDFMHPQTLDIF